MKRISLLLLSFLLISGVKADEGMWMLPLVEKLNIEKMQSLGLSMSSKELYNSEDVSLKDAIVIFGGGCTGVMVSPQGLLFTNHHCGYSAIQRLSSVENNYLRDGFTAEEFGDELRCDGLGVTFLVKVEDVTDKVLAEAGSLTGNARKEAVDKVSAQLANEAKGDTHYRAQVRPFYSGNEYYLFVYEHFNDVRLAYTPPSSIGKYGGETDNWMYPRHTGDFSVFRVYADKDGKPAEYSKDNVPYQPKHFAPVSIQGFQEGDYAMIMGYPGSTDRYASSFGIKNRVNNGNSARIDMRGVKQDAWKKFMLADEAINIAYANKYAGSSNYWKNSIGMNNAIKNLDVIGEKEQKEAEFTKWVNANPARKAKYGNVLSELKRDFELIDKNQHALDYLRESLLGGVELPMMATVVNRLDNSTPADRKEALLDRLFTDYYPEVDKQAFTDLLAAYRSSVSSEMLPDIYNTIDKKFKGNYALYVDYLFKKSVFTSKEKLSAALSNKKFKSDKDPVVQFSESVIKKSDELRTDEYNTALANIQANNQLYVAGLKEWVEERGVAFYPDANFTMRVTYGQILGYEPFDGASYQFYTTTKGVLDKEDPNHHEFILQPKLKDLLLDEDFAPYTDKHTGKMHVNFLSNNDITGGNSGSPVFNGKGEVIGLAFDGNWEAMSGDIIFENKMQRCINVDVRYMLFIMDKIGGADRLIKELTIN